MIKNIFIHYVIFVLDTKIQKNNAFIFTGSPVKRGMTGGVSRGHDISYNRHCEPDKAWQSIRDCFVVSLLAMTEKCGAIANAVWQSIRDCFVALLLAMTSRPDVIPDLIGYPENKKSSCADVVRWILGSSPRMTGKCGVIANAVWQSIRDYFVILFLVMTAYLKMSSQ